MSDRRHCLVVCRCQDEYPIQSAVVEYFCTVCKDNCFVYDKLGSPCCISGHPHRLVVSARCLNRVPEKCGRCSARGECLVVCDARPVKTGETCLVCLEDQPKFMVVFDPCGHTMCLECFRSSIPRQKRYVKNKDIQWVPACTCCRQDTSVPGSCSHAALNLLPRPAYTVYRERSFILFLAEDEPGTIVCSACNTFNPTPANGCTEFNCKSCGTILCVDCRSARSGCPHEKDKKMVVEYFKSVLRRKIRVRCRKQSCGEVYPLDTLLSDVRRPECLFCGTPLFHLPVGSSETLAELLRPYIAEWNAAHWSHVFFVLRAFAMTRKFLPSSADQRAALLSAPCPIVDIICDTLGTRISGVDDTLQLTKNGWNSFITSDAPVKTEMLDERPPQSPISNPMKDVGAREKLLAALEQLSFVGQ
jgi:hypothetical protein